MQRITHLLFLIFCLTFLSYPAIAGSPDKKPTKANIKSTQPADNRRKMPAVFKNSYIGLTGGWPSFNFSSAELINKFRAGSVYNPNFALRLYIGHFFDRYIAVQLSLMRPVKWIRYRDVTPNSSNSVWISIFGLTLRPTWPINDRFSLYGEAGVGLISRHGFELNGITALPNASSATFLGGAGLTYALTRHWHLDAELLYASPNHSKQQPHIFYAAAGFYYLMLPSAKPHVDTDTSKYIFPLNFIQLGFFTNGFSNGNINKYFAPPYIPIFWTGDVKTRNGVYLMYERNFFHTDRTFSIDWGASVSRYQTKQENQTFYAFSVFPEIKLWIIRGKYVDFYFTYSVAGPTVITRKTLDGIDTGSNFTFQDFMGLGFFLGKEKRFNINVKIGHYSNGNLFPTNPGIEIPLSIAIGYTF